MLSRFKELMLKATGLTQHGKLMEATAAIQSALTGNSASANPVDSGNIAARQAHQPSRGFRPASPLHPSDLAPVDVTARESTAPLNQEKAAVPPKAYKAPSATPTAPAASVASAKPKADTNQGAGTFTSASHTEPGAGSRKYKLYIPPQAAATKASGQRLPLVLMLHGCKQNPDDFALGTGMNEAASAQGFYVVYPEQIKKANASNCWNWFEPQHQQRLGGEPAILAGIVRTIAASHAIDPSRVYVAGLSAGGAMAAILGRTWPDVFAAVGVHSGLAHGAAKDVISAFGAMKNGSNGSNGGNGGKLGSGLLNRMPGFADLPSWSAADAAFNDLVEGDNAPSAAGILPTPPTIVFHGDRDSTVNLVNGEQVLDAALESASHRGDARQPETYRTTTNGQESTQRIYRNANGQLVAEHWRVHGAGHAWSGGNAKGSYTDSAGPDATAEMVRFFLAQRLSTLP